MDANKSSSSNTTTKQDVSEKAVESRIEQVMEPMLEDLCEKVSLIISINESAGSNDPMSPSHMSAILVMLSRSRYGLIASRIVSMCKEVGLSVDDTEVAVEDLVQVHKVVRHQIIRICKAAHNDIVDKPEVFRRLARHHAIGAIGLAKTHSDAIGFNVRVVGVDIYKMLYEDGKLDFLYDTMETVSTT